MSAMANSPVMPAALPNGGGHAARVAWTAVGLVLALAAVGIWVGNVVRTEFQNSYAVISLHQRVYPEPVHRLVVDVDSGSVTIEHGRGATTVVDTTGTRASRTPTDDEHLIGSTLHLRSGCGSVVVQGGGTETFGGPYCRRNFRIRVPGDVSVTATVDTGNLLVSGMHGAVTATVGTGNVFVTGDVGSLHVSTFSGSVVVRREDGSLDASTGTGDVFLADARGPVTVHSTTGNVAISNASASVHVAEGTGSITATGLAGSTFVGTLRDGNIEVSFTTAPKEVDASTQTGSISVRLPYGDARYQLHLKSGTGRVLPGIPNDPSSTRVIRALTVNGNVIVGLGSVPATPNAPNTPPTPPGPGGG
jgi:hypothetical protein